MITIIPIEPLNDEHHDKIIAAFNRFFIDRGGLANGYGDGSGDGYGDGFGDGVTGYALSSKCPEEWRVK